jgi:hypothetical protein
MIGSRGMRKVLVVLAWATLNGCTTLQEYPLRPHTCQYDGGINISNGHLLQVESVQTPTMRGDFFGNRKSVLISDQHYTLDSFRPVMMCVNPGISAEITRQTELAGLDINRRYAVMGGVAALAPVLPLAVFPWLVTVSISTTSAGVAGYLHAKFFEPEVAKLDDLELKFNREVAELVRTRNETSPTARLEINAIDARR